MAADRHTFLFADLVGFTALAESEGDDRALEVVLALHRRVAGLLAEHRAEQVKVLGDGVMLRCDDAGDAVRLGLGVVDDPQRVLPPVRVGVHTGPAVRNGGDWYGTTVNVAARLCAVAPGGEVLVSEATRRAAEGLERVSWSQRELHWLRNVSAPVPAYLVSALEVPAPVSARRRRWRGDRRLAWSCPRRLSWSCPRRLSWSCPRLRQVGV